MRSELIQDILKVEAEAEKITQAAKDECRKNLALAHANGEEFVRLSTERARNERQSALEAAQQKMNAELEQIHTDIEQESSLESDDEQRIRQTVDRLKEILVSSSCYEGE